MLREGESVGGGEAQTGIVPSLRPDRVVVINDLSEARGGATGIALASMRALRAQGIPVTFIAGDDASHIAPQDQAEDIQAVGSQHVLEGGRLGAMARGLYNAKAARALSAWISRNDTPSTIYHLHGWSKILSPSIFRALRSVSARLVVHAHDYFLVCPNGGYFNFRRGEACTLRPLGTACLSCNCDRRSYSQKLWRSARLGLRHGLLSQRRFGRILAVHDGMAPIMQRGGISATAIRVLRNPVVPWCSERVTAERNRVLLYVGRLDEDKGVDLLAAAARRARVRLRIIGAGPLGENLAQDYPEIEFTGWRSREEIARLCRDARALIMPSRWRETFGIAPLEGLLSGLPLLVSRNALIAPEIAEGGYGLLCDPHDRDGFAALLADTAKDDAMAARMSIAAYTRARELAPTPEQWIEQLLAHYAAVLKAAAEASPAGQERKARTAGNPTGLAEIS